jgi:hypothetical protein
MPGILRLANFSWQFRFVDGLGSIFLAFFCKGSVRDVPDLTGTPIA